MAALKIAAPFPAFPVAAPPPRPVATELRLSRWNNANAQPFIQRRRDQQEIEDDIRRHRRHNSAARITSSSPPSSSSSSSSAPDFKSRGTPSSPSPPSIPGKNSKYSKPPLPPSHPAFRRIARATGPARRLPDADDTGISVGDGGIAYRIKGAPFEFQYSYTEMPKVKPLAMREPPFLPFGPTTMPRPWTGRAPLPPSKKKLPEFDSFKPPPAGKKGVKPVQSPGPFLSGSGPRYAAASREEILGDPLTEEEVKELINGSLRVRRVLNMGRDGLTHNMLENIHAHWKRRRICKIKCIGVCTVDMDNVRQQLEEKTGGKIIYNRGGVIFLFRGRNYNYRTRPRFPLMLWKPVAAVYPRLIQQVPEGLTPEEATELRNKGHTLPPICKIGKNGLYSDLVQHVREAFEECELVRINCKGLNKSDYKKIGAKLKDLVPCTLLSFAYEHILVWRGKVWKSSLPLVGNDCKEDVELIASSPETTSPRITDSLLNSQELVDSDAQNYSDELSLEIPVANTRLIKDVHTGESEDPSSLETIDQSPALPSTGPSTVIEKAVDSSIVVEQESVIVLHRETAASLVGRSEEDSSEIPCENISIDKGMDSEPSKDLLHPQGELELLPASSVGLTQIENNGTFTIKDGIYDANELQMISTENLQCGSMKSSACLDRVMLLLKEAVDSGSAVILDDESLDANIVYQKSVALAKTAPHGPVFQHRIRKAVVQKVVKEKSEKYEEQNVDVEVFTVSEKRKNVRKSSGRREDIREFPSDVVPLGSLGVDELAKLLA